MHQLEPLPPVLPFPPPDYSTTFLIPHLIGKRESRLLSKPPFAPDEKIPFDPSHYHEHWYPILQTEVDCLCAQRSSIVLWNVKELKLTDWKRNEFSLVVPGLRENYPRLEAGDLVKMRQVIATQNGVTEPFFGTGLAFEARVIASQKREGVVRKHLPHPNRLSTNQRPRPLLSNTRGLHPKLLRWHRALSFSDEQSYSVPVASYIQHILSCQCTPILSHGSRCR